MALVTTTIIGPVLLPNGQAPASGYLRFVMDSYDTDGGQIVAPTPIRIDIGASGQFSAALWPNSRGSRDTHYGVFLGVVSPGGAPSEVSLGLIAVPESAAPVELDDLLAMPVLPGYVATRKLTLAQYNALPAPELNTIYLIEG